MNAYRKFQISLLAMCIVILIGVVGYEMIEGWSFLDALYMTVITISSVGFKEVGELSVQGEIFTIILILLGISVLTFAVANLTAFIVEGDLKIFLRRRKMEKQLRDIKDHIIVCGAGKEGTYAVEELHKSLQPVIVIDVEEEKLVKLGEKFPGVVTMQGNATDEETLYTAGIERAKGVIGTLSTDADNLFLVVTARGIRPDIRIVVQAVEERAVSKFRRAGADDVVSVNFLGGLRLASCAIRPAVVNFLDTMIYAREKVLRVEEVPLEKQSSAIGKRLNELHIPQKTGLIVVAVKNRSDNKYYYNPKSETVLQEDDILIVMGPIEGVDTLRKMING